MGRGGGGDGLDAGISGGGEGGGDGTAMVAEVTLQPKAPAAAEGRQGARRGWVGTVRSERGRAG